MTEAEKVERILGGDNDVLANIYTENYGKINQLIKRYDGNDQDAEDIFQDAMVDMIRNFKNEQFKHQSSISTYLYTICKYKMMNRHRSQKVKLVEIKDYDKADTAEEETDEEGLSLIQQALEKLSTECRNLLRGFYFDNLSLKELAVQLDYTEAFIRVKNNRCKNSLRKTLSTIPYIQNKYGYDIG